MKLTSTILFIVLALQIAAQNNKEIKLSTIDFHVFYNDFYSAQNIRTTSLKNVLDNNLWSKLNNMQMGLGFSYLKGVTKKLDFLATVDASYVDYLFKSGSTNGSSKFLLGLNTGVNIKMITDKHTIVPYLSGGLGFSIYTGKTGFYLPLGVGLQFNVFNEAFVFTNAQYRLALSSDVNYHFNYSFGIGTNINQPKQIPLIPKPIIPIDSVIKKEPAPVVKEEIKIQVKTVAINVSDEATGLPLSNVEVIIRNDKGNKKSGITDNYGNISFADVASDQYWISGILNNISTTIKQIGNDNFLIAENEIKINLKHNDPKFTLVGYVINKTTNKPEPNVDVMVENKTQEFMTTKRSQVGDGSFAFQLEANSDFKIYGKKANYISNIEQQTTKGLNRGATLYVKLELLIEEAKAGKNITLKNIYYDLGKTEISASASTDLEKLLQFLKDNPSIKIEIASHTDSRGSDASNLKLSQARAQAVVDYLVKKGIELERLLPKGYGETQLVNACGNGVKCTEEQHQQNRRTEFKVTAN